ncbi:MAG: hypothetical protein OEU26_20190 [Candidatus Tectomicrobia bacterium]|nr:hypothetical protein [Candidatus Tectomicrobia bacterium]
MTNCFVAVDRFISEDGPAIRAAGFVLRDLAHFHGVPHTSVLLVPVRVLGSNAVEILVYRRPSDKQVSPDTWDTFGGHVEVSIQNGKLGPPADRIEDRNVLYQMINNTAVREANEEIVIPDFAWTEEHLHRFGGYGDFECGTDTPGADNVEYSTLFVAVIPSHAPSISAQDTVGKGGIEVEVSNLKLRSVDLDTLLGEYKKEPAEFADDIGRILQQLLKAPGTRRSFERFLSSVAKSI